MFTIYVSLFVELDGHVFYIGPQSRVETRVVRGLLRHNVPTPTPPRPAVGFTPKVPTVPLGLRMVE